MVHARMYAAVESQTTEEIAMAPAALTMMSQTDFNAMIAELTKNARRYRFLRIRHDNFSNIFTHFRSETEAEKLDANIDAALSKVQA